MTSSRPSSCAAPRTTTSSSSCPVTAPSRGPRCAPCSARTASRCPTPTAAKAVTGYERGTITPFGSATRLPVIADSHLVGRRISLGGGAPRRRPHGAGRRRHPPLRRDRRRHLRRGGPQGPLDAPAAPGGRRLCTCHAPRCPPNRALDAAARSRGARPGSATGTTVRWCSDNCRKHGLTPVDLELEDALTKLVRAHAASATVDPSEAAESRRRRGLGGARRAGPQRRPTARRRRTRPDHPGRPGHRPGPREGPDHGAPPPLSAVRIDRRLDDGIRPLSPPASGCGRRARARPGRRCRSRRRRGG